MTAYKFQVVSQLKDESRDADHHTAHKTREAAEKSLARARKNKFFRDFKFHIEEYK